MKKIKQIFSVVLATLLALTMFPIATLASATDPVKSIPVTKIVSVPATAKGTLLPTETFTISMVPATDEQLNPVVEGKVVPATNANGQKVEAGLELTNSTATFSVDSTKNTTSGSVEQDSAFKLEFKDNFTHTGIYRYYVTETIDSNKTGYITYDDNVYTVDLYVEQNSSE
jgi:hypothetical protein